MCLIEIDNNIDILDEDCIWNIHMIIKKKPENVFNSSSRKPSLCLFTFFTIIEMMFMYLWFDSSNISTTEIPFNVVIGKVW